MATFEAIIEEAGAIDAHLPHVEPMREAVRKAHEWSTKVDTIQGGQHYPYLDVLEALLTKGRPIPVRLDQLPVLESQVSSAKS